MVFMGIYIIAASFICFGMLIDVVVNAEQIIGRLFWVMGSVVVFLNSVFLGIKLIIG